MKKLTIKFLLVIIFSLKLDAVSPLDIITYKMVDVKITKFTFLYIEAFGALEDNFSEEFSIIRQFASGYGIEPTKFLTLFLDTPPVSYPQGAELKKNPPEELTKEYLLERYGEAFIKTKRRAVVGILISPLISIIGSNEIKMTTIEGVTVKAYQSIDRVQEEKVSYYNQDNRLFDRIAISNFAGLASSENKYIGAAEMFDTRTDIYTFMVIPGDKNQFLENFSAQLGVN